MANLYTILLIDETKIAAQHHTQFITKPYDKQIKKKKKTHTKPTDLVSTWVEEVAQTDYVAVVQLSHDLQLPVLQNKGNEWMTIKFHVMSGFHAHGSRSESADLLEILRHKQQ